MKKLTTIAFGILALAAITSCGGNDGPSFPILTPFPAPLTEKLHQIRDRVAELRGLPVNNEMTEGLVTSDELKAYYQAAFGTLDADEHARLQAEGAVLKMLGLIGPNDDLEKLYTDNFSGQILGLYSPEGKQMVLVGNPSADLSIKDELTLAHEYTHSMQDAKYNITELRQKFKSSDIEKKGYTQYSDTVKCLIEGDAEFTEQQYADKYFGPDWRGKVKAEALASGRPETPSLPPFLQHDASFDYNECPVFVKALFDKGGWAAVDAAFGGPPATTEQVLQPEKYFSHEIANNQAPADIEIPGWQRVNSSQFGEFDVYNWALTRTSDTQAAAIAAVGWGAGWATAYRDPNDSTRVLIRLSFSWDSRQDLAEFVAVFEQIVKSFGTDIQLVDRNGNGRWSADGQYGVISLHRDPGDVDIRIASDQGALAAATKDLPTFAHQP